MRLTTRRVLRKFRAVVLRGPRRFQAEYGFLLSLVLVGWVGTNTPHCMPNLSFAGG